MTSLTCTSRTFSIRGLEDRRHLDTSTIMLATPNAVASQRELVIHCDVLRAILNRSNASGKARIRWPVAADSQRDGAIVAIDNDNNRDAIGTVSDNDTKTSVL